MASEIRVNKIENRSGLGTVTFADTGVDLAGIVTATTFSGSGASLTSLPAAQVTGTLPAISGANLTNLPAANLTGTLPAISGANLTGIAATDNVRTGILDVAGISTFRNTMNVGAAVTISESGIEASGVGITCASINGGQLAGRRNFIINGAMQVAEHSDSNAGVHNTYAVDRFLLNRENTTAEFTMSQSTTSPDGFSNSLKMDCTTADTSTAATEFVVLKYNIEGQDLQHLAYGTSAAKTLVLSFYVRSNLTGTYSISCVQPDNSNKIYAQTYTINSADTWERKTISIPADGSGVINNDTGTGFQISFGLILGSTYKGAGVSPTWESYLNARFGSQHGVNLGSSTSNEWYLTGLQLEVGPEATAFEHRSFAEELLLCQRYFFKLTSRTDDNSILGQGMYYGDTQVRVPVRSFVEMRSHPTVETTNSTSHFTAYAKGSGVDFATFDSSHQECPSGIVLGATIADNSNNGAAAYVIAKYDASTGLGVVSLNAEL